MQQSDVIAVIAMVAILVLAFFVLRWRITRAMKQIVRTLREQKATSIKSAITMEQMGIKHPSMWSMRLRDFKQQAVAGLVKIGIIEMTEDNKYYLSEQRIIGTKLDEPRSYYR